MKNITSYKILLIIFFALAIPNNKLYAQDEFIIDDTTDPVIDIKNCHEELFNILENAEESLERDKDSLNYIIC